MGMAVIELIFMVELENGIFILNSKKKKQKIKNATNDGHKINARKNEDAFSLVTKHREQKHLTARHSHLTFYH